MRTVLVTGDFDVPAGTFSSEVKLIHLRKPVSEQHILDVLPSVHGYIVGGPEYVSAHWLSCASELKHVVVMGTGTASFVDIEAATQKGINVSNTPGLNVLAVAEFTLAMMTVCTAGIFESIECVKDGSRWPQTVRPSVVDQSVGIIGMGNIGQEVAKALREKGCRNLYYWSRHRKYDAELSLGLNYTSIQEMVEAVDCLFIHIAGCEDTYGLVDRAVLEKSKYNLSIFNMSSPRIVCAESLKNHLRNKPEAFCFIDGYYNEGVDNIGALGDPYQLLTLPSRNLVVTSHLAGQKKDALRAMLLHAIAELKNSVDVVKNAR